MCFQFLNRHRYDLQRIDPGFQLDILILRTIGQQGSVFIGQNTDIMLLGQIDDLTIRLCRNLTAEDHFFGLAVHNDSTIEGQDISTVILQMQFFRQRHHAVSRSARSQHHDLTLLLSPHQCFLCFGCNFFILVGQRSVQIQNDHFVFRHLKTPYSIFYNNS